MEELIFEKRAEIKTCKIKSCQAFDPIKPASDLARHIKFNI